MDGRVSIIYRFKHISTATSLQWVNSSILFYLLPYLMYVSSECPAGEIALRHRFFSALGAHICNKYQIVLSAGLSKRGLLAH